MKLRKKVGWLALLLLSLQGYGQTPDSLLLRNDRALAELDSILNSPDSLSILGLIDSLLSLEPLPSQLALRVGYNSNANSEARAVGINTFGMSAGASFYHRSGLYADVATYWSQEYDPQLYLSIASIGYLGSITKYWSVMGEYGYNHYQKQNTTAADGTTSSVAIPFRHTIQLANFFDVGIFTFRADYSLLLGDRTAHRISPMASIQLTKKKWLGVDRLSAFPTVGITYGNQVLSEYVPYSTRRLEMFIRYRNNLPLFYEVQRQVWGVMNVALSLPVSLSVKKWTFQANYVYNIPVALPGENLDIPNSGFLSLSLLHYIDF